MNPSTLIEERPTTNGSADVDAHDGAPPVSPRDLVQFRVGDTLSPELTRRLEAGLSPSLTVKRDVERYYALLAAVRTSLPFEDPEIALIRRVAWDTPGGLGSDVPRLLWAEVADAIRHQPDAIEESGVDGDALVAKLRDLCAAELYALVEAIESAPHPALVA